MEEIEQLPATVGGRLRATRKHHGANQTDFAASLGASLRAYHAYEKDERMPPTELLVGLASKGISIDWVLTGEGEMWRKPQPVRLHNLEGVGMLDRQGKFQPLPTPSEEDLQRFHNETAAMWRRLNWPGVLGDIAGIDGDLAHRLADIHADRPAQKDDSVAPLLSLIVLLDDAYGAADLGISSLDVGRLAAEEYRAIYEGGASVEERTAAGKAFQARHMRAAAWAKNTLLKPAALERQK